MSTIIDLCLNETYLSYGIHKWVPWNLEESPMTLCIGQSGSGKSYCCSYIICKLCLATQCDLFYLDYKGDDANSYLHNCKRFYRYTRCHDGLSDYYNRFLQRQNGSDTSRHPLVLYWDEFSNYCEAGEKKVIEEDKKKLGIIVSMGRSFSCYCIISQQTAHATYFNQFRQNFSLCIGMGNLNDENRKMLFPDYAKNLLPDRRRGTGYLSFNGREPIPIVIPPIRNMRFVQNTIRTAVGLPDN